MFGSKASTMPGSSTACRGRDVLSRETICPSLLRAAYSSRDGPEKER